MGYYMAGGNQTQPLPGANTRAVGPPARFDVEAWNSVAPAPLAMGPAVDFAGRMARAARPQVAAALQGPEEWGPRNSSSRWESVHAPRMNAANPKALRRSIRRVSSFAAAAVKLMPSLRVKHTKHAHPFARKRAHKRK